MSSRARKIRVMIADDHAILRAGLRMLVNAQADMEVVSEVPDGENAVQNGKGNETGCGLAGPHYASGWRYEGITGDGARLPRNRVLVLTMHDDPAYLRSAIGCRSRGLPLEKGSGCGAACRYTSGISRGDLRRSAFDERSRPGRAGKGKH